MHIVHRAQTIAWVTSLRPETASSASQVKQWNILISQSIFIDSLYLRISSDRILFSNKIINFQKKIVGFYLIFKSRNRALDDFIDDRSIGLEWSMKNTICLTIMLI